jgi:hypothetical protein
VDDLNNRIPGTVIAVRLSLDPTGPESKREGVAMSETRIDLGTLTGEGRVRNLSGHEKGFAARGKFGLDRLDHASAPVLIVVPDYVYAISGSFVQGMFGPSLVRLGSVKAFFEHYRFNASGAVIRQIERGLAARRMADA